jgi:hypothetical protein
MPFTLFPDFKETIMKSLLTLAVCLALAPLLWADQPTPPLVPVPSGEDTMPPPLTQMTPVNVPALPGNENKKTEPPEKVASPPAGSPKTSALAAASTPTTESPAPEKASSNAVISAGALTDYFPVHEGTQWIYEYLKPASGETAKDTYTVKCIDAKQMPNGMVRTIFETTENGQKTQDHYSLYDNKVEHMAEDGQASTGDFVFKIPAASGGAGWSVTESNGTVHKSKAAFGQAQVYKKIYPDCVVVTEKVVKGGKTTNTVIYYYAKGTGLVAIEVYSPKMKLVQDKSVAIMSGPDSH